MPSFRTKSISTKVTDEEYAQFEASAGEQTISEWAREVLLKATKPNASEQTVLAEVLALRTILLNVHFAVSQGQTLTTEDMRQLIERADQNKLSKAQERLAEATTGGMPYRSVLRCSAQCVRYRWLPLHAGVDAAPTALSHDLRRHAGSRGLPHGQLVHAVDGGDAEGYATGAGQRSRTFRYRERREHVYADRRGHQGR